MDRETFDAKMQELMRLQKKINEMTVGERYSQAGQSCLDSFAVLLDELRQTGYPINLKFW